MKLSLALDAYREDIRRIVAAHRGLNPRVFGSVLHHQDTETSDLHLLIDAGGDWKKAGWMTRCQPGWCHGLGDRASS